MTWIRPTAARPCTLVVCRGCCCGSSRKNPGTDHARQLARLHAAAAESGGRLAVRTSDCLGPCAQANVIVIQPSGEGRQRGGRAVWVGWALDDDATDEVAAYALAGGPGIAPLPPALDLQRIDPPADTRTPAPRRRRR
ncbi:(2Fe-2S) ferredoxin domain-containing protein [Streptomyces bambusae]|uniref:(2Fe-2S) ferredoxin domain-containing protein n=1 Tax=Streptomyces bambusae TaxID=1550616 RepID=UPI001CFCB259|nr:(2Fe-2S) ferredoxin domain-containing protein [Streptomyces bambusae]MCB5168941.1 (2Fe-2S) ferredoxin domain-containing protein [Streptomyces bambusae]